jgi:hypothetical protein
MGMVTRSVPVADPQAVNRLLGAAEELLALIGDTVMLCPRYGTEANA